MCGCFQGVDVYLHAYTKFFFSCLTFSTVLLQMHVTFSISLCVYAIKLYYESVCFCSNQGLPVSYITWHYLKCFFFTRFFESYFQLCVLLIDESVPLADIFFLLYFILFYFFLKMGAAICLLLKIPDHGSELSSFPAVLLLAIGNDKCD